MKDVGHKEIHVKRFQEIDSAMIQTINHVVVGDSVIMRWPVYNNGSYIRFTPEEIVLVLVQGDNREEKFWFSLRDAYDKSAEGTPMCFPSDAADIKPLRLKDNNFQRIIWDVCAVATQAKKAMRDCPEHVLDQYGEDIESVIPYLYHAHKIRSYGEKL